MTHPDFTTNKYPFAKTFDDPGDFAAFDAANAWCNERGISVGRMQAGAPCGLLFGDFDIQKWRNLSASDIAELDGRMTGGRNGPVTIYLNMRPK